MREKRKKETESVGIHALRSGELAQLAGVSRDALRYYERRGLLPAAQRAQNGYRRYPPEALERVRLIRGAMAIGFTADELGEILQARDCGVAPCQRVHALALEKTKILDLRMAEMAGLQKALRSAIRSWRTKLKSTVAGKRAGLLEMFIASHPESTRMISPMVSPGLKRKFQAKGRKL